MFPVLFAREAPLGRNEKVAALPTMDQPPPVWVTTWATHRGKKHHASLLGLTSWPGMVLGAPRPPSCGTTASKADGPTLPPYITQGMGEVSTRQPCYCPGQGSYAASKRPGGVRIAQVPGTTNVGSAFALFVTFLSPFHKACQQLVRQLFVNESWASSAEGGSCGQMSVQHMGTSQLFAGSEHRQTYMLTETDIDRDACWLHT